MSAANSNLVAARDSYMAAVRELELFQSVTSHEGQFDEKEVARYTKTRGNAFVIALAGMDVIDDQGTVEVMAHWGAIVMVESKRSKDRPSLEIVEAATIKIRRCWGEGYGASGEPQNMRVENLYTSATDKDGFSLWELTWSQKLDLLDLALVLKADPLESIEIKYDLQPIEDGADLFEVIENEQIIELEQ